MFNPWIDSYLQFDCIDENTEPGTERTAHTRSLVVPQRVVLLKTRPFVKRNNAECTNISSFTSLLMCRTHFALSCRIRLLAVPTSNNFAHSVFAEIPGQSVWGGSCLGPLGVRCFSGHCSSSELGSVVFWTFDIHDLPTSCRKSFTLFFLFVQCSVHKKALNSAQSSRYNTTFLDHLTVYLRIE